MRQNSVARTVWAAAWSARAAGVVCQAEGRAALAAGGGGHAERGSRFPLRAGAFGLGSRAASRAASLARPHAGAWHRPQRRSVWKPWKHAQEDELTEESHLKAPTGHRPVCNEMMAHRDPRAACEPCASGRAPR
jgi:hypothetical protein